MRQTAIGELLETAHSAVLATIMADHIGIAHEEYARREAGHDDNAEQCQRGRQQPTRRQLGTVRRR